MSNWDDPNGESKDDQSQPPAPQPGQWAPSQHQQPQPAAQWSPSAPSAASGPGGFTLGPLTVADVLDVTFSLLKKCWKQLVVAVLVYAIPAGIVGGISSAAHGNHGFSYGGALNSLGGFGSNSHLSAAATGVIVLASLVSLVVALGVKPYVQGAITRIVAAEYLGRTMEAKEAFAGVRKLYWRFVGASVLVSLCSLGGVIFPIAILFTAVIPVIAIEEETISNALGRSWALMKRRFWSYLSIRIIMGLIAGIVGLIFEIIPIGLAALMYALNLDPIGGLFMAIGQVLAALVTLPIAAIVATLIYFDSRVRNEGFDLQMMAARIPSNPQSPQQ